MNSVELEELLPSSFSPALGAGHHSCGMYFRDYNIPSISTLTVSQLDLSRSSRVMHAYF